MGLYSFVLALQVNLTFSEQSLIFYGTMWYVCNVTLDNPASDFCPPEVSVVTSGWTKVAVEKAYEYSLGNTLRHVTGKVKEVGHMTVM